MGPAIFLDKSTFQGLSRREVRYIEDYFFPFLTPLLALEIGADLSKDVDTPELSVIELAKKFGGSGPMMQRDFVSLCRLELMGHGDIPMKGHVIPAVSSSYETEGGGHGLFVNVATQNSFYRAGRTASSPRRNALAQFSGVLRRERWTFRMSSVG